MSQKHGDHTNKPNFPATVIPYDSTILSFHHTDEMAMVQNEPNFVRAPGNGRGRPVPRAQRRAKDAKRTQFRPARGDEWRRPNVQNEPNLEV